MRSRAAVVIALILALTTVGAIPARAGGPTSVLLASPYTDGAAGLYYDDPGYSELTELLGGDAPPATSASDRPSDGSPPYVTATWLIHDVTVWRIDRIFVFDQDDVWVVSQTSWDEQLTGEGMWPGETGGQDAIWHRPADPARLIALLADLGLVAGAADTDGGRPAAVSDPVSGDPAGTATNDDPAPALTASSADAPASSPWWWALAGLIAGLALAGGAAWLLTVRRRARTAPAADQDPVPVAQRGG